ncbi:MAG TPA: c-type cytochrome [Vicinamibacterales bacterium]|nr:c-type cytochrome [Vicinamibacterales bacterium]
MPIRLAKLAHVVAASGLVASMLVVARADSQNPAPPPPPAQPPAGTPPQGGAQQPQPPAGRGQGRGARPESFPAQQRPPGDPALITRGKTLFDATCAFCHGKDMRGGENGGPNLLRSEVTLTDTAGEKIAPIVRGARADKGMPPIQMSDDDIRAVAEYIHSTLALSPRQGMPPPGEEPVVLDIVVGDVAEGEKYFAAKCSACHSTAGDLQGIASRITDPKTLQNTWVSGGAAGGRGRGTGPAGASANGRAVTATVVTASGEKVEGRLLRLDDFYVAIAQPDGTVRSFTRRDGTPKLELKDPLEGHRKLLAELTDKNMHDVTAYLVTLK